MNTVHDERNVKTKEYLIRSKLRIAVPLEYNEMRKIMFTVGLQRLPSTAMSLLINGTTNSEEGQIRQHSAYQKIEHWGVQNLTETENLLHIQQQFSKQLRKSYSLP